MRIAMVSEHASPLAVLGGHDAGGQNVHVAALSAALAERGHKVEVYTRRDDPELPERQWFADGVDVVHVPLGPPREVPKDDLLPHVPQMAEALRRAWAQRPPDVVHGHFWMSGLAATEAARCLHRPPAVVQTFHALGVVKRRHQGAADTSPPARVRLERRLVGDVDAVVATCRDEVAELLAMGADPERLHVVPCGVDLERFSPRGPHHVPWTPGTARLLSLGRLVERKGVETVVETLRELPDAELVVAGGPDVEHLAVDEDVARIRAAAAAAGVADRVRLLGRVDASTAAALLRAADVLVTVPWYEPFGIVPLEAMACGTPVVASAVGGMLDTVQPGVTGLLVPPRDPGALARALEQVAHCPSTARRMGAAGERAVRERYAWPVVAAATEDVYHQLLDPGETTAPAVVELGVREEAR